MQEISVRNSIEEKHKNVEQENARLYKELELQRQKPMVIPVEMKLPIVKMNDEQCYSCDDKDSKN